MGIFENILKLVVNYGILLFEAIAIIILISGCIKGFIDYLMRDEHVIINMSKKMNTALCFKLGAEILRLVSVREFSEITIVAGIVAIHAAISVLISWELKKEDVYKNNRIEEKKNLIKRKEKSSER